MKIFVYTHDIRGNTTQLMRYPDDDEDGVELLKETAPIMDYACFETVERINGEWVRFITLTPAMTPITMIQTWSLLNKLSATMYILEPEQRILL